MEGQPVFYVEGRKPGTEHCLGGCGGETRGGGAPLPQRRPMGRHRAESCRLRETSSVLTWFWGAWVDGFAKIQPASTSDLCKLNLKWKRGKGDNRLQRTKAEIVRGSTNTFKFQNFTPLDLIGATWLRLSVTRSHALIVTQTCRKVRRKGGYVCRFLALGPRAAGSSVLCLSPPV